MPELAEVEAARRLAHAVCVGRRIVEVHCADDAIVVEDGADAVRAALTDAEVTGSARWGKQMWLELGDRPALLIHLGMTGTLRARDDDPIQLEGAAQKVDRSWPPRFTKLHLVLDDGAELAFTNARRLGRLRLRADPRGTPPISALGFDPYLGLPDADDFAAQLRRRKTVLKGLLLNQAFAAGVGNWIADEVLYQAGIDPRRKANTLSAAEAEALRVHLGSVVTTAVTVGARKDRFPLGWLFHKRWGKQAGQVTEDGHAIEHMTVAGRTTAWVPAVQG